MKMEVISLKIEDITNRKKPLCVMGSSYIKMEKYSLELLDFSMRYRYDSECDILNWVR